jgi:hypothetical protein
LHQGTPSSGCLFYEGTAVEPLSAGTVRKIRPALHPLAPPSKKRCFFAFLKKHKPLFSALQTFLFSVSRDFKHLYFGMTDAITPDKTERKGDTTMKNAISKKTAYIGAGSGLVLFAIFGLLPGSLLGGAAGIKFAGLLFGLPLEPGMLSRAIVLASMLVGVLVSGIAIVTAASAAGWLLGRVVETSMQDRTTEEAVLIGHK